MVLIKEMFIDVFVVTMNNHSCWVKFISNSLTDSDYKKVLKFENQVVKS